MRNKIIITILLLLIAVGLTTPLTYWKGLMTDSLYVIDGAYIAGGLSVDGDLTLSGTVTITGEVTIDSLIVPMWFDFHNGTADTATIGMLTVTTLDADSIDAKHFVGPLTGDVTGNATTASDVDTTGTDIAAALGDRQPLCTTLTQWCSLVDSVTSGAADSVVIGWAKGKPDTLIDVR